MKIDFAHIRERSTNGGWIDFAVFGARSASGTQADNAATLSSLTVKARLNGLKIDQSALAFQESGRTKFFGDKNLVDYLKNRGVPRWTHSVEG